MSRLDQIKRPFQEEGIGISDRDAEWLLDEALGLRERRRNLGPCRECLFAEVKRQANGRIYVECHRRSPIAASDDSSAWWPIISEEAARKGCGDFEVAGRK